MSRGDFGSFVIPFFASNPPCFDPVQLSCNLLQWQSCCNATGREGKEGRGRRKKRNCNNESLDHRRSSSVTAGLVTSFTILRIRQMVDWNWKLDVDEIDRRVLDRWAKWSIEGSIDGTGYIIGWRESFLISWYEKFKDSFGIMPGAQRDKSYRKNTEFLWVSKKPCFVPFLLQRWRTVPSFYPFLLLLVNPLIPQRANFFF